MKTKSLDTPHTARKSSKFSVSEELANGTSVSMVMLIDSLIADAHARKASDIHIDPGQEEVRIRFRVDGLLEEECRFPTNIHTECIARLKILAGLRTDEHFVAQDGRFRFTLSNNSWIDIRISIAPTYYGENAVLRLLSANAGQQTFCELGIDAGQERSMERAVARGNGMILVTGPTGSGKTTTLYALMRTLANGTMSLVSIEDPIEYSMEGVSQIQANERTGLSFAHGLRSILRQDPDVIMVGEIRDAETAGLAVNAALTGHLVLSTLHTNDAPTTLLRLVDMRVEPYLIASTVRLIIAQRLVRRICKECKRQRNITESERSELSQQFENGAHIPDTLSEGSGCAACNGSGYRGRIGVYEFLVVTSPLQEALARRLSEQELRVLAISEGMGSMEMDGLQKIEEGHTTIEEVLRIRHE
ncbi:MAG: GspE/PulE family protein [Patescibacteria group bacterium]